MKRGDRVRVKGKKDRLNPAWEGEIVGTTKRDELWIKRDGMTTPIAIRKEDCMPIKTVKKITSWSYSRYAQYTKCPFAAKCKFIDKLPEPPNDAMARGDEIHKMAEAVVKGGMKKIPKELILFNDDFLKLRKLKAKAEETWAFTKEWGETTWDDWKGCWLRVKTDAHLLTDPTTLKIIDYKTGKQRDEYEEPMELYGVAGMLKFPKIKKIITSLWFLDHGTKVEAEYNVKDRPKLMKKWEKNVTPMMNDTRFAPKPGNHCRWCEFSKSKGGPCVF